MSRTLNLVDCLLAQGRRLQQLGQLTQATSLLQKLSGFRTLPKEAAEQTQSLLADLQMRRGEFARARRHLRAALSHGPKNADYHHRFAVALEDDPDVDPAQALAHHARCVKLEPKNPRFQIDFAYAALNAGSTAAGLKALRKAQRLAPDDPEVLTCVVRGLTSEGLEEEARRLIRAALFRNARDLRFRAIWQRFQFDVACGRQQPTLPQPKAPTPGAEILPFVRPRRKTSVGGKTIRCDGPATLEGPQGRAPRRRTSRK